MPPIKIYLCDLTHCSIVLVSDTIPINVGFIGSYVKKKLTDNIDVSFFKYPENAIERIIKSPPDILALSNYSWNSNLSEKVAKIAKDINPQIITVQGGPNFPHDQDLQTEFLIKRPATDIYTVLEGEVAFLNIVERVLAARDDGEGIFESPIDGTVFILPETRLSETPTLIRGSQPPRIRDLDDIPSPYLNGMLDGFFDGNLTPFIETNRGCPFRCSFCHTGVDYFQKINMFSTERVCEEINYIAPKVTEHGIVNLHLADTNFGMYSRDRKICEALYNSNKKFGWPLQIMATTGKNNKNLVIDITSILGNMFTVNMSVQSMDDKVLSNVRRSNIKLDHYIKINDHLRSKGRTTKAELIIGLPGETRETFINGVDKCIKTGVSMITIYTLIMLHGTEFKDPFYRKKYGMKGMFRIVPLNFGEYSGHKVFDYEEVCVENNNISFEDYIYLRGYSLLVEVLLNGRPFDELFRYVDSLSETKPIFLRRIYENMEIAPKKVRDVMDDFLSETRSELWDSEKELIEHYQVSENYSRLVNGEVGGNLIFKYKSQSIAFTTHEWIQYISDQLRNLAKEKLDDSRQLKRANYEIDQIVRFCNNKVAGLLNWKADIAQIEDSFDFNIIEWLHNNNNLPLASFACEKPVKYIFKYTDDQLLTRKDNFKRYGTDVNALSKIVTRISNLESLFRKIITPNGDSATYVEPESDQFTRYSTAN